MILEHYADIECVVGGPCDGGTAIQSSINDGRYWDTENITTGRRSVGDRSPDHYQYIDVERINDVGGHEDEGTGDQAARSQGRERLDPSVLATLRQPQNNRQAAASTQQTTEQIEMTAITDQQNTVGYAGVKSLQV